MTVVGTRPQPKPDQQLSIELLKQIGEAGLQEKNPLAYLLRASIVLVMTVIPFAVMASVNHSWILLVASALFAAVASGQMAFLGHDAGHRQIARKPKWNNMSGLAISLLLGIVRTWWVEKHDLHHADPNTADKDPDIEIPFLAFSEEQAMEKRGFLRFLLPYQAFFLYPLFCLEGFGLRLGGALYALKKNKLRYGKWELLLFGLHFILYGGAVYLCLPSWPQRVVFILIHQMAFGFYMGMVFAPNHKGMEMLERDSNLDPLIKQVVTARDIKGGRLTSIMYGGLNHQITHHISPNMPCANLRKAQRIVYAFCEQHNIPYHSTSFWRAQVEILSYLHRIGQVARTPQGEAI